MPHPEDALKVVSPGDVATKLRLDYSRGIKDATTKAIDELHRLCTRLARPDVDLNGFLKETADMISRHFGIASVAVAIWDPAMKHYKYEIVIGVGEESVKGFKQLFYTKEQLFNERTYPSHEVSKQTRLYLSEERPYAENEEFSYNRPALLGMKRHSLTDSLEADYLCVYLHGPGDEILGWMEISGTKFRKLPDVTTIKWIELIGSMIVLAVRTKR